VKISFVSPLRFSGLKAMAGLVLLAFLFAPRAWAQAAPGPLPQTQTGQQDGSSSAPTPRAAAPDAPRTKMMAGTWRLNADDSDDPYKKCSRR